VIYLSLFQGRYDPKKVEEVIAKWWHEKDIQKRVFEANKKCTHIFFLRGATDGKRFHARRPCQRQGVQGHNTQIPDYERFERLEEGWLGLLRVTYRARS